MNRARIYTVVSWTFALIFVFGSMFCMNFLLQFRVKKILSTHGKVEVESPVRAWQEGEETDIYQKKYMLTTTQMEDTMRLWNEKQGEVIHDPVEGQLTMEEAIESGKKWIEDMQIGNQAEDKQKSVTNIYSIHATLSVAEQKDSNYMKLEPYYSFWSLELSSRTMNVNLWLNAVTGNVWRASIMLYEEEKDEADLMKFDDLILFADMAGIRKEDLKKMEINSDQRSANIKVKNSPLYVQVRYEICNSDADSTVIDYKYISILQRNSKFIIYNLQL